MDNWYRCSKTTILLFQEAVGREPNHPTERRVPMSLDERRQVHNPQQRSKCDIVQMCLNIDIYEKKWKITHTKSNKGSDVSDHQHSLCTAFSDHFLHQLQGNAKSMRSLGKGDSIVSCCNSVSDEKSVCSIPGQPGYLQEWLGTQGLLQILRQQPCVDSTVDQIGGQKDREKGDVLHLRCHGEGHCIQNIFQQVRRIQKHHLCSVCIMFDQVFELMIF